MTLTFSFPRRAMSVALVSVGLFFQAGQAAAGVSGHGRPETVTQFMVRPEIGDVYFLTNDPAVGCEAGYWLRPADAGFKVAYAAVLLAYTTKSVQRVWAHDDSMWSGSSGKVCRLQAINPL